MLKNIRCLEATEYFKQCVSLNAFFAQHKKYYPQEYYHNEYWRVSPHYDNVFVNKEWTMDFNATLFNAKLTQNFVQILLS